MTDIRGDGEAGREIDVARFMSDMRRQAEAAPGAMAFKVARKPGIAWINALKRERRRRRSKAAGGQVQVDVSLRALLRLNDAEFIRKAYIKLLGRRADPSGLATHLALLNGKLSSKIKVLEILRACPEGRARNARVPGLDLAVLWIRLFVPDAYLRDLVRYDGREFVDHVYAKLLRRDPDPAGYAYRLSEVRRGWPGKVGILAELVASSEGRSRNLRIRGLLVARAWRKWGRYDARLADLLRYDGAEFVDRIYGRLLYRDPDPAGYAYRLSEVRRGWPGKVGVLAELVASSEGRSRNLRIRGLLLARAWRKWGRYDARLADLLRYDGAEFVDQVFARLLWREAPRSEHAAHIAEAQRGRAGKLNVLAGVVSCAEGRRKGLRVRGLTFAVLAQRLYQRVSAAQGRMARLIRTKAPTEIDAVRPATDCVVVDRERSEA